MGNSGLIAARKAKNDEFYTQYETIEEELKHYKKHFEGKTVYCNCDDPRWSNFFKYFVDNFHELKLKRLIASCYVDQSYNLFTINDKREPAVWVDYDGWLVNGRVPEISEIEVMELNGDGDFRSDESIELLKQSDIVVTNPPFSLFRHYVSLLTKYDKKFLIIGGANAIAYKNIFTLVKDIKMWVGVKSWSAVEFKVPDNVEITGSGVRTDEYGVKLLNVQAISWWTNMDYGRTHEDIILTKVYKGNDDKYPKYDNYDAINVDKVAEIPKEYKGVMGVPISFIDKWNPEQFKIIGLTEVGLSGIKPTKDYSNFEEIRDNGEITGSSGKKATYKPVLNGKSKSGNYFRNGDNFIHSLYTRILIQNKRLNPEIYGG